MIFIEDNMASCQNTQKKAEKRKRETADWINNLCVILNLCLPVDDKIIISKAKEHDKERCEKLEGKKGKRVEREFFLFNLLNSEHNRTPLVWGIYCICLLLQKFKY